MGRQKHGTQAIASRRRRNIRAWLLERAGYRCQNPDCSHGTLPLEKLTIDHIIPVCFGGTNKRENLQILCKYCNHEKGQEEERRFERSRS